MTDDYAAENTENEHLEEGQSLVLPLEEDNDTPFSPPTDPVADASADIDVRSEVGLLDPTHQATDNASDIDTHQLYDEGLAGATEATEPNAGNAVVDYNPEADQRQTS